MKILVVGHAQHGKDTVVEILAAHTGLRNAGTTSVYLAKYVAAEDGVSVEEAYANRRRSEADRQRWRAIGDRIRSTDPALLVREAFAVGDISGGCRGFPEIQAVREQRLADLIIWVDAGERIGPDSTMEFDKEWADIVVDNSNDIDTLTQHLLPLAKILRLAVWWKRYKDLSESHREWSLATFGDKATISGRCKHAMKELREISENPADIVEHADLALLSNDIRWRSGHTVEEVLAAAEAKLAINRVREWPAIGEVDPNGPIEHHKGESDETQDCRSPG